MTYKDMEHIPYECEDCKYKSTSWFEEPCSDCCARHCGYEPKEEMIETDSD